MKHNFSKMSSEELVALMETVDEQTKQEINAELEARENAQTGEPGTETEPETETEAPAAEAEADAEAEANAKLDALLKECQKNVGHKCKVVPIGTIEYVEGIIVGCIKIKRSNTVAYAIKLDGNKRVIKNYKAPLFEILDEVVSDIRSPRTNSVKREPWSDEKMEAEVAKYISNVGRKITIPVPEGGNLEGQITGIVPVKRSNSILYRVTVPAPTEENPNAVATLHKSVANTNAFTIAEADEASEAFLADYLAHRDALANKPTLSGHELVIDLELKLEKAKEAMAKAEAKVKALEEALQAAREKAEAEATQTEGTDPEGEDML